MSDRVVEVNEANWETEVVRSDLPVLLDFGMPGCGPCVALDPVIEALAKHYEGRIKFVKLDTVESPALAQRFGIRGVPHLQLMRGDERVAVLSPSARTRTRLVAELDGLLA